MDVIRYPCNSSDHYFFNVSIKVDLWISRIILDSNGIFYTKMGWLKDHINKLKYFQVSIEKIVIKLLTLLKNQINQIRPCIIDNNIKE